MSSLLRSVAVRWRENATLCALVPFASVFTGRVPQTELYDFPYVRISSTRGLPTLRSDKTQYNHVPLSFHIWVDEDELETGEEIAEAISDAFANTCWYLDATDKVIDVRDEGEPGAHQTDTPTIKAWEVIKMFTVCIERARVDTDDCCLDTYDDTDEEEFDTENENT